MPNRTIAIGDVHGHAVALRALLGVVKPTRGDVLVFLGDYINRGPDGKGVVDAILDLQQACKTICLFGNHEEMLLAARWDFAEYKFWQKFGGDKTAESYKVSGVRSAAKIMEDYPDHEAFYRNLATHHETESHIFVHAAYDPSRTFAQQHATLRWESYHKYPPPPVKTLVCGHSPQQSLIPDFRERQICIDTGCGVYKDGRLTALDVGTLKYWQVNQDGSIV